MVAMTAVPSETMSAREGEVLDALRDHLTNAEIAHRLHISVRTVESHVSSLLRKFGAADRRALATRAAELAARDSAPGRAFAGLPTTWTSFVGRTAELQEIVEAAAEARLVTLVGPGGIGKTRLVTVAAERIAPAFRGGGAFVDLVPVTPEFVVPAVATALGLTERLHTTLETVVHDRLRQGPSLLVLDNCEHVLGSVAAFVQGVLAAVPDAVVMTTTREGLGLPGERLVAVQSLGSDAETLFVDRAAAGAGAGDADPTLVAEVCRRLDGLPLAIELAAARSGSLGVDGLLAGLDDHLRLLSRSGGAEGRHRSLRAVIDWSHDLLDEEERKLFRRLAVFAAWFDLASVAAVAADGDPAVAPDVIGRLADKSLLMHGRDARGSRWRMLDTVRAHAREQLTASGEDAPVRNLHLAWATSTARDLERTLDDEELSVARFDAIADDLRVALGWARRGEGAADGVAFDLAMALGHLSYARGFLVEARGHYVTAALLATDGAAVATAERRAADVAFAEMRGDLVYEHLLRAAHSAESEGNAAGAAVALADAAAIAGRCRDTFDRRRPHEELVGLVERAKALAPADELHVPAHVAVAQAWIGRPHWPDPTAASEALVLARSVGDPVLISNALDVVCAVAELTDHLKEASGRARERLDLLDQLPRHDPRVGGEVADIFHMATESAIRAGELPAALAGARRAYEDRINNGLPYLASSRLVMALALLGAFDDALAQAAGMRETWERAGRPTAGWMAPSMLAAALVHGLRGDHVGHDRWRELADLVGGQESSVRFGDFVEQRVALHLGQLERAMAAEGDRSATSRPRYDAYARGISAEVAVVAGAPDALDRLRWMSPLAAENDFVAACLERAAGRLHEDEAALRRAVDMWDDIDARFERACTLVLIPSFAGDGRRELAELGCPPPAV